MIRRITITTRESEPSSAEHLKALPSSFDKHSEFQPAIFRTIMSGYPYGNPAGGYPGYSNYPLNSGFPAPPPVPVYGGEQSCASLYGSAAPPMPNNNNFPSGNYGGNPMPPNSYNYGGSSGYPLAPPVGGPMSHQPYGGTNRSVSLKWLPLVVLAGSRLWKLILFAATSSHVWWWNVP